MLVSLCHQHEALYRTVYEVLAKRMMKVLRAER